MYGTPRQSNVVLKNSGQTCESAQLQAFFLSRSCISRASSSASTASILRTPSSGSSFSRTSSSASSSSRSSVVTFSRAAPIIQWGELPGQESCVAPAPSRRWVADSKQLEESRRSKQARSPNFEAKLNRTDNHFQGKRTNYEAANISAAISIDVRTNNGDQSLEQLKAAIHRRYKYRRQKLDCNEVVVPQRATCKKERTKGMTQAEANG